MHEKLVVVLDTNVFVSALLSPMGAPGLILRRFRQGDFNIVTSRQQIKEIQAVLKRPSLARALPKGTTREAIGFFHLVKNLTKILKPPGLSWDFKDSGDHFLLDLIVFAKANFLITGDHRLQSLKLIQGTAIVSPVEFLGCL